MSQLPAVCGKSAPLVRSLPSNSIPITIRKKDSKLPIVALFMTQNWVLHGLQVSTCPARRDNLSLIFIYQSDQFISLDGAWRSIHQVNTDSLISSRATLCLRFFSSLVLPNKMSRSIQWNSACWRWEEKWRKSVAAADVKSCLKLGG